jgi:hypothetical protein
MEISWFLRQLLSKSAIRHSLGSTSWHPVTGIHDDHEAFMLCEWHNMTEPSGCFCQCNRNAVCRFCTVFCPNFGLVIIYLSTPTVRSWWNQWLSIVACHSNSWWRWWSEGDGHSHKVTSYNCTYCYVTFQLVLRRFLCGFLDIYDWNSQGWLHSVLLYLFLVSQELIQWFHSKSYWGVLFLQISFM